MTKVNQRTATVNTIMAVLKEAGINYELNGDTPVSEVLESKHKESVRSILFTMFREKQIEYKESFQAKVDDDSELKKYISGLVNNWVRKAKEFNCGQTYKAKNPGSRAGSSDPQIKEMRKLLQVTTDDKAKATIQATIDKKLAEIRAEKNKVEVDLDAIPAELRKQLGL